MIFRYPGAMAEIPYAPADIKVLPSWLLGRAAERGRRLVADALAGVGLRLAHHAVLSAIAELGPVSQADLVRKLGIDPKDMVTILDEIQAAGLVTRARPGRPAQELGHRLGRGRATAAPDPPAQRRGERRPGVRALPGRAATTVRAADQDHHRAGRIASRTGRRPARGRSRTPRHARRLLARDARRRPRTRRRSRDQCRLLYLIASGWRAVRISLLSVSRDWWANRPGRAGGGRSSRRVRSSARG